MEKVELPIHKHPLLPITRFFSREGCNGCGSYGYIYGGYRCNELGCKTPAFHKECAESLQEIKHFSHPDHPLKLHLCDENSTCSRCERCLFKDTCIYICSICEYKLDLHCAKGASPLLILENSNVHEHPLELFSVWKSSKRVQHRKCNTCYSPLWYEKLCYICYQCKTVFHAECVEFSPEVNHTSHPQHPLKLLTFEEVPDYADKKCLLCEETFDESNHHHTLHHCDVCNFSICRVCMKNPPPVRVESPTTHEHELHLVPRLIDFTCNACGTLGDRSPYFCLQCNFMIHRQCIDLPRVININRHDHRVSYTRRLGHGEWKCIVCRKRVDGFYGAYTCVRCPSFVVHARCATRKDVWEMIELEGMPEEEEIMPFEVIDNNTIKHFSHDHNLEINKDGHDCILPENIVCEACVLQILSEPFYSCKQCNFILHEKCANHPLKKRHVYNNLPFTLLTSDNDVYQCWLCLQVFAGFRYHSSHNFNVIDVRCAAISDTLEHGSHQHPLYYYSTTYKHCSRCGKKGLVYRCDECDYSLDVKCALLPKNVMSIRYDDHPLFLSFGNMNVDSEYWCDACETKVNPKEWFYTCSNDCGTTLHVSCVVGDFSFIMPGSHSELWDSKVISNTSICRPFCFVCNSRCKLPTILKRDKAKREAIMEEHHLRMLVEEIASYNHIIGSFFPAALWSRLPHIIQTLLRNYIVSLATYFVLCSLWCFYFYHWKHDIHIAKEYIPSRKSIMSQIHVARKAMPWVSLVPTISEYLIEKGFTKCYFSITEVGPIAYITHIIIHIVLVEFWLYWTHRALHDIKPLYKHFHSVHHRFNTKTSLSPFAGAASHPVEAVLDALPYTIILLFVPMHFKTELVLLSLNGIWTFNTHSCLESQMWPFLTADYHTMHHTMHRYNYGNYTLFMDWLFGTLRHPHSTV